MRHFATERISMAVQACATARRCLDLTVAWCRDRSTFGAPLATRQVVRHRLAEMPGSPGSRARSSGRSPGWWPPGGSG
jgi:alkylation response protein AidB-like acyl-CoA dehydrogenase